MWNPDLAEQTPYRTGWQEVPDNGTFDNGFKAQWEEFLRSVLGDGEHVHDFWSGVRGVRLAKAAAQSSAEDRLVRLSELGA